MNVSETCMTLIDNLLNLYRVDTQVRGLRGRLESAQRYLAAQERLLNDLLMQRDELSSRKKQMQATIANLESEIAAQDAKLEKFRKDLDTAATSKQYSAVLSEMNTVKADRSRVEDRMLEELERVEQTDRDLETISEQIAEREKVRTIARQQLEEKQSDVGQRLAELERERVEAASAIPASELDAFEKLSEDFEGEAMAEVLVIDKRRREYACGACHMHMPFEQISVLKGGADRVVHCTACRRILYMQDETRESLAKK
jgi:uncharacterized protein